MKNVVDLNYYIYMIAVVISINYITVVTMSELVVFKANELAVSRYSLTEHETKLILYSVALLNPSIKNPTLEDRTVKFTCAEYAKIMGITRENAWGRLNNVVSDLMKRTIELIYTEGPVAKKMFQWVIYSEFNRENQTVELVFSDYIQPYLFQLKRFIKYNLEHVKSFESKYSMRVYEWLLKELSQRKTHKGNIEISIKEFKFMLMLEKNYPLYAELNRWILKPVENDLNTYSNMKLVIEKRGRPADTLIFQVELDKKINLNTNAGELNLPEPILNVNVNLDTRLKKVLLTFWTNLTVLKFNYQSLSLISYRA